MKRTVMAWTIPLLFAALEHFAAAQSSSWTPNGPLPRVGHSAVFDPSTRQMIIFGGTTTNSQRNEPTDVWRLLPSATLSGVQNWVALNATGTPGGRFGHLAGYDPASNRMMVFSGGGRNACSNDVWVLTNANGNGGPGVWSQLSSDAPGRGFAAGAYDPGSNTLMVYGGGYLECGVNDDYWVLSDANGLGGTPTWTEYFPFPGGPGPRTAQTGVHDPTSNELILFGGSTGPTDANDVWILQNANGTRGTPVWEQLFPTGTPPAPRQNSTATYDPVSNVMTIFGGTTCSNDNCSGNLMGDVWILTNANGIGGPSYWIQIAQSSAVQPPPRSWHSAVYDASRNVMIIFGGWITPPGDAATQAGSNDVLFLSDANGH